MSDLDSANLTFSTRITRTLVQEDKKSEDAVVETTFEGEIGPGAFADYSKDLEYLAFKNRAWESIKSGPQRGKWAMTINDPTSGTQVVYLKDCTIKNIAVKIGKEDVKTATLTIAHKFTTQQKAIECAVSTDVDLSLDRDMELLPGINDAPVPESASEPKQKSKKVTKKKAAQEPSTDLDTALNEPSGTLLDADDSDGPDPDEVITDDDTDGEQALDYMGTEQIL